MTTVLDQAGCGVRCGEGYIQLARTGPLRAVPPVRTAPYPGFPTDCQAILMAALLRAQGTTVFVENIFQSRYRHVPELARMGADLRTEGRVAVVCGTDRLLGTEVVATDLRDGAGHRPHPAGLRGPGRGPAGAGRPNHSAIDETTRTAEEHRPWQGADGTTISGGEEA